MAGETTTTTQAPGTTTTETPKPPAYASPEYQAGLAREVKIRAERQALENDRATLKTEREKVAALAALPELRKTKPVDALMAIGWDKATATKMALAMGGTTAAAAGDSPEVTTLKEELRALREEFTGDKTARTTEAQKAEQARQQGEIQQWHASVAKTFNDNAEKFPHIAAFNAGAQVAAEVARMIQADPRLRDMTETEANGAIEGMKVAAAQKIEESLGGEKADAEFARILKIPSMRARALKILSGEPQERKGNTVKPRTPSVLSQADRANATPADKPKNPAQLWEETRRKAEDRIRQQRES